VHFGGSLNEAVWVRLRVAAEQPDWTHFMSLVLCGSNTMNKRLEILLQKVSAGGVVFEKCEKPLFSCKIRHLGVPPADEKPKADVYVGDRADWTKPKKNVGVDLRAEL